MSGPRGRAAGPGRPDDPFAALGLPAHAGLTDGDVQAAWRRIAAATHPDRDDGGDPARFGAAAAAYAQLRTSFGRGEARADLGPPGRRRGRGPGPRGAHRAGAGPRRMTLRWPGGYSAAGRGLSVAVAGAAAVAAVAVAAVGLTPATIGLLTGALTVSGWALWRRGGRGR